MPRRGGSGEGLGGERLRRPGWPPLTPLFYLPSMLPLLTSHPTHT